MMASNRAIWYIIAIGAAILLDLALVRARNSRGSEEQSSQAKSPLSRITSYQGLQLRMFGLLTNATSRLKPLRTRIRVGAQSALTAGKKAGARLRSSTFSGTGVELAAITAWALWVGRSYLDFRPWQWPYGGDFALTIEPHYIWELAIECGGCALWNGLINGGSPAFAELHSGLLHPLVVLPTLLFGVISGAKVTLVASLVLAGFGQWWIAKVLKLGRMARVWSAAAAVVGGHLAARMDAGLLGMVLSTAACSLVIAPGLDLGLNGRRRATAWFGVTLGLAILAGQGYAQMGLGIAVLPAFLIFMLDDQFKLTPLVREYLLGGLIAVLLAGVLLVPALHFLPNFGKFIDTGFRFAQPLEYTPLNLVIRDASFFKSEILGKSAWLPIYATYIGWIPIFLATVGLFHALKSQPRTGLFFGVTILALVFISSREFILLLARVVPDQATMIRYPPMLASLTIPLLLGLSAIGLDHLMHKDWPTLALRHPSGTSLRLNLMWILLALPALLALKFPYDFGQPWLGTQQVPSDVIALSTQLPDPGKQWVQPPGNSHLWVPVLLQRGHKVTNVFRPSHWKHRDPPKPTYHAILPDEEVDQQAQVVGRIYDLYVLHYPANEYASIETADGRIVPCDSVATGGEILVRCEQEETGTLIVRENAWHGWTARVDGEPAALIDDRWLSLHAPVGAHTFEFHYRPWDVPVGLALTIAGVLLAGRVWLADSRARELPDPESSARDQARV